MWQTLLLHMNHFGRMRLSASLHCSMDVLGLALHMLNLRHLNHLLHSVLHGNLNVLFHGDDMRFLHLFNDRDVNDLLDRMNSWHLHSLLHLLDVWHLHLLFHWHIHDLINDLNLWHFNVLGDS